MELDPNMSAVPSLHSPPSFLYLSSAFLGPAESKPAWEVSSSTLITSSYGGPEDPSLKAGQSGGGSARDTAALLLLEAIITNIPWNVLEYK